MVKTMYSWLDVGISDGDCHSGCRDHRKSWSHHTTQWTNMATPPLFAQPTKHAGLHILLTSRRFSLIQTNSGDPFGNSFWTNTQENKLDYTEEKRWRTPPPRPKLTCTQSAVTSTVTDRKPHPSQLVFTRPQLTNNFPALSEHNSQPGEILYTLRCSPCRRQNTQERKTVAA